MASKILNENADKMKDDWIWGTCSSLKLPKIFNARGADVESLQTQWHEIYTHQIKSAKDKALKNKNRKKNYNILKKQNAYRLTCLRHPRKD